MSEMIRFSLRNYIVGSVLLTAAVVTHISMTRQQFFPTMVYLASSKGGSLVLAGFS
jgi:hypothetical protein